MTRVGPGACADEQDVLGYYPRMLRPGQTLTLPVRAPAMIVGLIESRD